MGAGRQGNPTRVTPLREREWRVIIHEQQDVCLNPEQPSERTDAELVHPLRIGAREQNDEPSGNRREAPGQEHKEQDDELMDREENPERDRQSIARPGRVDDLDRSRIRRVAEWWTRVLKQHEVRERPHAPPHVERRKLSDPGDVRAADHDREPADDGEEDGDCAEPDTARPERFTLSDKTGTTYRLSGANVKAYVWRNVRIRGGLVPSPNLAAQAGAIDQTKAAMEYQGANRRGTGNSGPLEFSVTRVQRVTGSCAPQSDR